MLKFLEYTNYISDSFMNMAGEVSQDILKTGINNCLKDMVPLSMLYIAASVNWGTLQGGRNSDWVKWLRCENVEYSEEIRDCIVKAIDRSGCDTKKIKYLLRVIPIRYNAYGTADYNLVNKVFSKYRIADCDTALFMITHYLHAIAINKVRSVDYKFIDKYGILLIGNNCKSSRTLARKFGNVLYCDEVTEGGTAKWYRNIVKQIRQLAEEV